MYNTLFISFINWDSLMEIPAVLKNGGCNVDIFCTKDSWVLNNKFYENAIIADADGDTFVNELLAYIEKNKDRYDWIIPGDDIIIRLLNEKITSEEVFYKIMPLTKIQNRDILGSKKGFQELCDLYNIKAPRYMIYNEGLAPAQISEYMGYPLMIKMDKSEGGFGVFLCENETEMIANLAKVTDKTNLVFQQYITGYEVNTELLCKDGELIVYNYSKRLKTIGKFGVSTQRVYFQNTELETELQRMAKCLGLNGFGNVVFMYSEAEKAHYLIEVDVRPNSWMYYGKFTGNNFSHGVSKIVNNDLTLLKQDSKFATKKTIVCLYKKDMYRCLLEKDFKEILKWLTNGDGRWRFIPFYDKKTVVSCTKYLLNTLGGFMKQKVAKTINEHFYVQGHGKFSFSNAHTMRFSK